MAAPRILRIKIPAGFIVNNYSTLLGIQRGEYPTLNAPVTECAPINKRVFDRALMNLQNWPFDTTKRKIGFV